MSAWDDEYAPPALAMLRTGVREYFNLSAVELGIKGDEGHRRGYHRSRRWIYENGLGAGDYSVKLEADKGGDQNWLAALDIGLNEDRMKKVTARLLAAAKAKDPRMQAVREFFGTLNGSTVTGWDLSSQSSSSSDNSHLWHVHISFYRSRAGDNHLGLLDLITGQGAAPEEDDMDPKTPITMSKEVKIPGLPDGFTRPLEWWLPAIYAHVLGDEATGRQTATQVAALTAAVKALAEAQGQDPEDVLAAVERGAEKAVKDALRDGVGGLPPQEQG